MLKKLRIKFIALNMATVAVVLAVISPPSASSTTSKAWLPCTKR